MLLNINSIILITLLIFLIWISAITFWIIKVRKTFQVITQGVSKQDLKSILESLLKNSEIENKKVQEILKKIDQLEKASTLNIQKIGLVRFNPFADTGGDQSFVIALLDGKDNGVVISSLHSRDVTRIYAKPIENSKAIRYELSKEEQEAIKKAKSKKGAI
jgi:hypothetical protein